MCLWISVSYFFFFKQKTAYEMRISDWSSDVCSSDLVARSLVPGRYIEVARRWQDDDRVELHLEMEAAVASAPAAPDIVAFTYGPIVLAGALGRQGLEPGGDIVVNERKYGEYNGGGVAVPAIAGDPETPAATLTPGRAPLEFSMAAEDGTPVRLIPYHRIAHERYATYWKIGRAHV